MFDILAGGFFGILMFSTLVYLIPFIGPSTMILSGTLAAIHVHSPPILIGIAVALGASAAKAVMYYVSYFAGKTLSQKNMERLKRYGAKMGKWKSFAIFMASATPIPDEPVLVSLALVEYSPLRFLAWFLLGKLVITIPGAYLGRSAGLAMFELFGDIPATIISIVFTIAVTAVLMKVDLEQLWSSVSKKWPG